MERKRREKDRNSPEKKNRLFSLCFFSRIFVLIIFSIFRGIYFFTFLPNFSLRRFLHYKRNWKINGENKREKSGKTKKRLQKKKEINFMQKPGRK